MKWLCSFLLHFLVVKETFSWAWFDSAVDTILGERCIHRWLKSDVEGLKYDFSEHVFGQPFLERALVPLVKRHLGYGMPNDYIPKKALAVSFHGSPGVGKTYVTQLIAKHLFREGEKSAFYKFFSLSDSWLLDEKHLKRIVVDTVSSCDRAVFVFDEIEKMPEGIFEVIKSFLDFHSSVGNVDYRKSIFIFISNVGMDRINSLALSLWKNGKKREDFMLPDFEKALQDSLYNEHSGLKKTKIVKNFLIDLYLPFLPLERKHIEMCIAAEVKSLKLHILQEDVRTILGSMAFLPEAEKVYSASGCKPVSSLVKMYGREHNNEL